MIIKRILKTIIIIAIVVLCIIIIADNSKFFWKTFNTMFCENPKDIKVSSVINNYANKTVEIKGKALRDRYYAGYVYWTDSDGNMYIGLKYNKYMGYEEKTSAFNLKLTYTNKKLKKVYIVNGTNNVKVWPSY